MVDLYLHMQCVTVAISHPLFVSRTHVDIFVSIYTYLYIYIYMYILGIHIAIVIYIYILYHIYICIMKRLWLCMRSHPSCIVHVGQVVGLGGAPYACSHISLIRYEIMWSLSGQSTG